MCLFGFASVKEILDTKKDPAILFISPVLPVVGAGLTLYPKLKKNSFESEFAIKAQDHITEEVVYDFERKNRNGYFPENYSELSYFENPLYPGAKIEFWEQFDKPVQVLLEEGKQTGIELEMVPPIEFMNIIRRKFMDNLKVSHDNVSFAPSNEGYGL